MLKVDLNCDLGESFGLYTLGEDEEMMKYITSANIACGYHGGDPQVMRRTVEMAKHYGVAIGAHPGFPDLLGFGRRYMTCTPAEVKNYILYQIGALKAFADVYKVPIQHCKPHGALFMAANSDEKLARAVLEALVELDENMITFAFNGSAVVEVGRQMGVRVAKEVYSDRVHTNNGSIVMTRSGQRIDDLEASTKRVVRMVKEGKVVTDTGDEIAIEAQTICTHGDTPGAPLLVKAIREALEAEGVKVTAIADILN